MIRLRGQRRHAGLLVAASTVLGALASTSAQQSSAPEPGAPTYAQMRHNSGQNVQPVFQGWNKNPDGTFNFVFGYFNRNYVEQPSVPIGADNTFSPGDADRGQPAFFYPRVNRAVFRVIVPANFGSAQLTWTLRVNGQIQRALGSLGKEWEIDPNWDFGGGETPKNKVPQLTVVDRLTATVGAPIELTATVVDDGNPPVASGRGRIANQGQDAFPTLHKGVKGPVNVPLLAPMPRARRGGVLSAGWTLFRGPAAVDIAPREYQVISDKTGGRVAATVTFTEPGTYVLRAEASDGTLHDIKPVTVVVK